MIERLRSPFDRLQFWVHWHRNADLLEAGVPLALAPSPPRLGYRGERAEEFRDRIKALLRRYTSPPETPEWMLPANVEEFLQLGAMNIGPMFTKRDGARQRIVTVLSTRSQELRLGAVRQCQTQRDRIDEMPPEHRWQMVNALRRLDQEAGWDAPIRDLEAMLP